MRGPAAIAKISESSSTGSAASVKLHTRGSQQKAPTLRSTSNVAAPRTGVVGQPHQTSQLPTPLVQNQFRVTHVGTGQLLGSASLAVRAASRIRTRSDIDMTAQRRIAEARRLRAAEGVAIADWELTKADQRAHRMFLCHLLAEVRRYHAVLGTERAPMFSNRAGTALSLTDLMRQVEARMSSGNGGDQYVDLIREFAALGLFVRRPLA